ncbi:MAG: DUF86 domain-containing protein, partial [Chloroflexota bacterium]|nr:DUF86 domain-containing protein [Chloroflexota bacterium]
AKVQFVKENMALLRQLSACSESDFVADKVKFYAAVHALQVSVEAMLDTFSHALARLHLGVPTSDRATLELARDKGLTTSSHFAKYIEMNKFRNKVVHGYMDVDPKIIYSMLQNDLDDFQMFFADIRHVVENEQAKERNGKRKKANGRK